MNVLITGTSSGIGKALKEYYLNNNHVVYSLDINELNDDNSFQCDITDYQMVSKIKDQLKNRGVIFDIILNVAGIHQMASLVESDYFKMKKVIDVNLTGTMLINNVFHSLLKEKGRIIIVTSEVASFAPMPFNGLYNVSKTALDTYAQALRQELNLINQKVITIRPGAIKTPLSDGSLKGTQDLVNETVLYKKQSSRFLKLVKSFMGKPLDCKVIAKYIYKISLKNRPRLIYKKHQNIGLVLLSILPLKMQCWIIKKLLNKR